MREKCAGAGDVFFGSDGVELVFGFVGFAGNGEKANAVDGGVGGAQARNREAGVVPSHVDGIGDEKQQGERSDDAEDQARSG